MDQHPLSLKLFKKQQSKTKKFSLFLKKERLYKENLKLFSNKGYFSDFEKNLTRESTKHSKKFNTKRIKKTKFYLSGKGQILMEGLFFIICILSFLLAVQFFQSVARKEIQKERLTKQNIQKQKAPWYKPAQKEK